MKTLRSVIVIFLLNGKIDFFFSFVLPKSGRALSAAVVNSHNCLDCVQNERAREEGTAHNSAGKLGTSLTSTLHYFS